MSIRDVIRNEAFYHVYQPVFKTGDLEKIGFEALLRSDTVQDPEKMLNDAEKEKQLFELDSRSFQKAVQSYLSEGPGMENYLFVNIYPSTIINPSFPFFLKEIMSELNIDSQQEIPSSRLVLEISESEFISSENLEVFKESVRKIKKLGIQIAIDDFGKGFSLLTLLTDLEPNFLKFDYSFTKDLHLSEQKQKILRLFKKYCDDFNCYIILEGIDNELDLNAAKSIGIPYVQGFLLGRPGLLKNHLAF